MENKKQTRNPAISIIVPVYKTERFLNTVKLQKHLNVLDDLGAEGVRVLSEATPKKTGKTAASWTYEIQKTAESTTISWINTKTNNSQPKKVDFILYK